MEVIKDLKDCSNCGAENAGVMRQITRDEIKLGKIGDDVIGGTGQSVYTLIDLRRPPLVGARIPAIKVYADICGECCKPFNFRIEKGHATMPSQPGLPPVFS